MARGGGKSGGGGDSKIPAPPPAADVIDIRRPVKTPGRQPESGRKRPGGARSTARNVQVALRRADVLTLRCAGYSYTKIAETISAKYDLPRYSRADAAGDVRIAMDQIVEEPAREWLAIELSRLDQIQGALWAKAMNPTADQQIAAVLALLRVMDRRSRYLGLDSPVKHDLTGGDRDTVTINLADPAEVAQAGLEILEQVATDLDRQRMLAAERELPGGQPG